jgi:two-component system, NtrC family, response regulator PilR
MNRPMGLATSKILMIDDDLENLQSTGELLKHWGFDFRSFSSGKLALQLFFQNPDAFPILLLDLNMPEISGLEVLHAIKEKSSDTIVIIYSCDPLRDQLKAAIRAGADDFLLKDEGIEVLNRVLLDADEKVRTRLASVNAKDSFDHQKDIQAAGMIGKSPALAEVARLCLRFQKNQYPILLLGETGTGKELAARAIHGIDRKNFFPYNCAATTQAGLIESELFGSVRGAFTGSTGDRAGILEAAKDGSVFLDEIHHLTPQSQASLLRVLSQSSVRRVGSTVETPIHCRFIAAAKPELETMSNEGKFLQDLMYRLDVLRIELPPLRERTEDIEVLAQYFLDEQNRRDSLEPGRGKSSFTRSAIQLLQQYPWPGNVRELRSWITTLSMKTSGTIDATNIMKEFGKRFPSPIQIATQEMTPATSAEILMNLERRYTEEKMKLISEALEHSGSQRKAAAALGINESSLRALLKNLRN